MPKTDIALPPELIEKVLAKLGLSAAPPTTLKGLSELYAAWCQAVPFDNSRKLIALRSGVTGPLPGDDPQDFFQAFLTFGSGGTCWAGNGAMAALLNALGFEATHGYGTMLVAPGLPPNHGTVVVQCEGNSYLVDASLLCGEPLLLDEHTATGIDHPAWGLRCEMKDGKWHILWRPQMRPEGLECRIDQLESSAAEFRQFHEGTRAWGPFNYALSLRANRGNRVVGIAFGQRVDLDENGDAVQTPLDDEARVKFLVETVGWAEEHARRVPADQPTPPPPGSQTALAQFASAPAA